VSRDIPATRTIIIVKGREVVGSYPSSYIISTTISIELFTGLISVYKLEESIT
jgi:hypothetical protein